MICKAHRLCFYSTMKLSNTTTCDISSGHRALLPVSKISASLDLPLIMGMPLALLSGMLILAPKTAQKHALLLRLLVCHHCSHSSFLLLASQTYIPKSCTHQALSHLRSHPEEVPSFFNMAEFQMPEDNSSLPDEP